MKYFDSSYRLDTVLDKNLPVYTHTLHTKCCPLVTYCLTCVLLPSVVLIDLLGIEQFNLFGLLLLFQYVATIVQSVGRTFLIILCHYIDVVFDACSVTVKAVVREIG